jgi:hypothetical protein
MTGDACSSPQQQRSKLMNSHNDTAEMNRGIGACLDQYIESFEDRLKARNYTAGTIKTYRVLIRRLAVIMEEAGVRPEDLTVELAAELPPAAIRS